MSKDGFFSHYPFFTPPPGSEQEPVDPIEDARASARRMVGRLDLFKLDFTVDPKTSPGWFDRQTNTLNFRDAEVPAPASALDPATLASVLLFPEGRVVEARFIIGDFNTGKSCDGKTCGGK